MNKKVLIGISGGVDSGVAAILLKEQGYQVIGFTMIVKNKKDLSIEKELEDAKEVCRFLEIEHIIINISNEFEEKIESYFLDEYSRGRTPSPCNMCNELIKFRNLIKIADEKGIDYIATGHYAKIKFMEELNKYVLIGEKDNIKDQTYMLYRLTSEYLKRIIFPIEKYTKEEIRNIAQEKKLKVFNKKDSQGLCFAKEGYLEFLKKKLGDKIRKGNFVDENENILGSHDGYQLYTIGQRRGLGLNVGNPYFVIDIIPEENKVMLGDFEKLLIDEVIVENYKINILENKIVEGLEVIVRPRNSSKGMKAFIKLKNKKIIVKYQEKNAQNSRGQHIVFYYNDMVLGGGIIK